MLVGHDDVAHQGLASAHALLFPLLPPPPPLSPLQEATWEEEEVAQEGEQAQLHPRLLLFESPYVATTLAYWPQSPRPMLVHDHLR